MVDLQPSAGATHHELVITRDFAAPRALVFTAFTEAERLMQWWGPKELTMDSATVDLRPGGVFHYSMRGPDDAELWGKFVYREITPPERLVFTNSFSDPHGNTVRAPWSATWPLEVLNTLTFTEHEGKTTLTLRGGPINATPAEVEEFAAMAASMQQGFGGTFDKLDQYLASATT